MSQWPIFMILNLKLNVKNSEDFTFQNHEDEI